MISQICKRFLTNNLPILGNIEMMPTPMDHQLTTHNPPSHDLIL